MTPVARYRTYADTRGDKSSGFRDSNKRRRMRKEGSWGIGGKRKRKRKLSFPRRSITRRHYFLLGRRYKWCSTIRERPIDILSTDSRTRYARAPKSAVSAVTGSERRRRGEGAEGDGGVPEFSRRREISQGAQTTEWNFSRVAQGRRRITSGSARERKADPTNDDALPRK